MENNKKNIFDLTHEELKAALNEMKQQPFRAKQLCDWIYKKLIFDPEQMLNLSKNLRETVSNGFSWYLPEIEHVAHSKSDNSYKFLLKTNDGKLIESIFMTDKGRSTICVSCMIGCPLRCKFCATGSQIGFVRMLTPAEIAGQVLVTLRYMKEKGLAQRVSSIVFMGMGEPLINKEAVKKSIYLLTHPECFALSPSRISVSTAGFGPGIAAFIEKTGVRLAVSLHFPTNKLRSQYMPVNKKFPLEDLIAELKKVKLKKRDYILIEYLLLGGINDSIRHAQQLQKLISNLKVKVNLIPYNPTETFPAEASSEEVINNFARYLHKKGIFTSVRRSKGLDVDGGCGQFALKKQ